MRLFFKILTACIFISSCQQKPEDDAVTRFKYFIGADNFERTNYFLETMDAKLEETFKTGSSDENYRLYLSDVFEGNSKIKFNCNDCDGFISYELSGMENKFLRQKFDTVYYDENGWLIEVYGKDTMRSHEVSNLNDDEIILEKKETGYPEVVHWGKLLNGLKLVSDSDSMALGYYDLKYHLGEVNPEIPAEYFLSIDLKPSQNFFYRLFVLIEIYRKELMEYGC